MIHKTKKQQTARPEKSQTKNQRWKANEAQKIDNKTRGILTYCLHRKITENSTQYFKTHLLGTLQS